jgi:hypothetical protein
MFTSCVTLLLAAAANAVLSKETAGMAAGTQRQKALAHEWLRVLQGTEKDSPVTRVVNLLKEMQTTLQKEMEEDEDLFKKLGCWCNQNTDEKQNSIAAAEAKIAELESTIETLTARSAELKTKIAETEKKVVGDKETLATATAQREKEAKKFHGKELDSIQDIENLKAALVILSKHQNFFQVSLSFIQKAKREKGWEDSSASRSLDEFMFQNGGTSNTEPVSQKFLQQEVTNNQPPLAKADALTQADKLIVQRAMKTVASFAQAHHSEGYYPSYGAQSGEVLGVMQTLKEEMEADLKEAQKLEKERAAAFAELKSSKTMEIEAGEKMAEQKEDELASTDMDLAEAKEDLDETKAALAADQKFVTNLKSTCKDADSKFEERKKNRLEEIEAVADTIEILTEDDARDAMKGTFSFMQISSSTKVYETRKLHASRVLRSAAAATQSPVLSALATSVELNAFTKVKKAIQDNIDMLKLQQEDEVKKHDWCNAELQKNEMSTMKNQEIKEDGEAEAGKLESKIKRLMVEVEQAKEQIAELQVNLQRASENRKQENSEYQKTFEDQTLTIAVLHKALDRLAEFYDKEFFVQTKAHGAKQTPPVPQMEYSKSKGAGGVMSMIEKLIFDAKKLVKEAREAEASAQAAYEETIEDTNTAVENLQKEVTNKLRARTKAKKDLTATKKDIADAKKELDGLAKYNADIHEECDYILKNYDLRQQARSQEKEALQQALQILKGAQD